MKKINWVVLLLITSFYSCNKTSVTHSESRAIDERSGEYFRVTSIYNYDTNKRNYFVSKTNKENIVLNYRFVRGLVHPTELILKNGLLHIRDGQRIKVAKVQSGKVIKNLPLSEKANMTALQ